MKINTKIRYGLRMLIAIAQGGTLVNTTELGARMQVSPKYLRKLAGPLEKAGLIESVQGIYGGYRLARPAAEIAMKSLLDAFGETISFAQCLLGSPCPLKESCQARQVWQLLDQTLRQNFLPITLADILAGKVRRP